jgi:hypothetical protein
MSQPVTLSPRSISRRAIAVPMRPNPTTAIVMGGASAAATRRHAGKEITFAQK